MHVADLERVQGSRGGQDAQRGLKRNRRNTRLGSDVARRWEARMAMRSLVLTKRSRIASVGVESLSYGTAELIQD